MKTKRLSGNRCQCPVCDEYFVNAKAFDEHRQGKYPNRSCLSPEMMMARGQLDNRRGFWMTRGGTTATRKHILAGRPQWWDQGATVDLTG